MLTHKIMQEIDEFVVGNQKIISESLATLDPAAPAKIKDTLEVLDQSLQISGILVKLYRKYPRFMLKLINLVH